MRIHEQRDKYRDSCLRADAAIIGLMGHLDRKIARPYPDGTCAPEVNVNTDVIPQLREVLELLREADHECKEDLK